MPRRSRPLALAVAVGCAAGLAACGAGSAPGGPNVGRVPLVAHTRIVAGARRCDVGSQAFCARELVLVGARGRYPSSELLLAAQTARLRQEGWATSKGDTDYETAVESPDHRLHLTLATASDELRSVDEGRIERTAPVARALATTMFTRAPALSVLVEAGAP